MFVLDDNQHTHSMHCSKLAKLMSKSVLLVGVLVRSPCFPSLLVIVPFVSFASHAAGRKTAYPQAQGKFLRTSGGDVGYSPRQISFPGLPASCVRLVRRVMPSVMSHIRGRGFRVGTLRYTVIEIVQ